MKISQHKILIPPAAFRGATKGLRNAITLLLLGINANPAIAATTSTLVPNGVTAPLNGFIASGSAINPSTNLPYRHLWISDHLQGLCRIDPDLDTAATLSPGSSFINSATCTTGGPAVYDPQTQKVYIADDVANKLNKGVVRQDFLPAEGGGHGLVSTQATRLGDSSSCGVPSNRPSSMAMGPDGNLYLGFFKSGNLMRINGPGNATVPCSSFQTIGSVPDGRRTLGLAWITRTLYGLDGGLPWKIDNADQCGTPNHPGSCAAAAVFANAAIVPGGIGSNQLGATPNGTTLYIADVASVTKIDDPNGIAQITTNWANGMSLPSSISVDTAAVSVPDVFIADDPTAGAGQLQGHVFKVADQTLPAAPGIPANISATAGDGLAVVNWTPGPSGSAPTSSYTVHEFIPPDLDNEVGSQTTTATSPVPTTLAVTGLTNGISYAFKVSATNSVGTGELSVASNTVTPQAAVAPDAPQNLSGIAGNAAVALAWQPPLSNGGSPITKYTVDYHNGGPHQFLDVPANLTGTTITSLVNNSLYSFQVTATNAAGASIPSNQIDLMPTGAAPSLDLALSMSGPAEVQSGATAVYTLLVTNTGGLPAPQVRVDNVVPESGFGSATFSTTRGSCLPLAGTALTCNLGPMDPGQSGTVTVTLSNVTAAVTNNASVTVYQADGVTLLDEANSTDNTGSVTTSIAAPPPPPQTTADLQLSGSASTGGPKLNSAFSLSFTVKNAGPDVAENTVFSADLPNTLKFTSANANGTACSGTAVADVNGGTVVCNLGNFANTAQSTITINVTPTSLGTISTTGSVSTASNDTKLSNNVKTVSVTAK